MAVVSPRAQWSQQERSPGARPVTGLREPASWSLEICGIGNVLCVNIMSASGDWSRSEHHTDLGHPASRLPSLSLREQMLHVGDYQREREYKLKRIAIDVVLIYDM